MTEYINKPAVALIVDNLSDVPECIKRSDVVIVTPVRLREGRCNGIVFETFIHMSKDAAFLKDAHERLWRPNVKVKIISLECKEITLHVENGSLIIDGSISVKLR